MLQAIARSRCGPRASTCSWVQRWVGCSWVSSRSRGLGSATTVIGALSEKRRSPMTLHFASRRILIVSRATASIASVLACLYCVTALQPPQLHPTDDTYCIPTDHLRAAIHTSISQLHSLWGWYEADGRCICLLQSRAVSRSRQYLMNLFFLDHRHCSYLITAILQLYKLLTVFAARPPMPRGTKLTHRNMYDCND